MVDDPETVPHLAEGRRVDGMVGGSVEFRPTFPRFLFPQIRRNPFSFAHQRIIDVDLVALLPFPQIRRNPFAFLRRRIFNVQLAARRPRKQIRRDPRLVSDRRVGNFDSRPFLFGFLLGWDPFFYRFEGRRKTFLNRFAVFSSKNEREKERRTSRRFRVILKLTPGRPQLFWYRQEVLDRPS